MVDTACSWELIASCLGRKRKGTIFTNHKNDHMKNKMLLILALVFGSLSYAQLTDGSYTYANDDIRLSFQVGDEGNVLSKVSITYLQTGKQFSGTGEWFEINPNGMDEDYDGPMAWYQFQTGTCYYDFNLPEDGQLQLNQFECTNGWKKESYTLRKQ